MGYEADMLRKAMGAWRKTGALASSREKLRLGLLKNGYEPEYAERLFEQIRSFSEYGFPESHSASFALLVYASAWLKYHYPAAFCCALLNSQPMGFNAPAQLVADAKRHGVAVRPADVNASDWDCTLERSKCSGGVAVRLWMVRSLREDHAERLVEARREGGPYRSVPELAGRARLPKPALSALAAVGAFRSMELGRRAAVWGALGAGERVPRYEGEQPDAPPTLPALSPSEEVAEDYRTVGLSLRGHPIGFVRPMLDRRGVLPCVKLAEVRDGAFVSVAGVVTHRQRPGTSKGIIFMSLEDDTGGANLVVYPDVWQKFRRAARSCSVMASGRSSGMGAGRRTWSSGGSLTCRRLSACPFDRATFTEPCVPG